MKSPFLIFFIVFNLLTANLAVAYNMHDEQIGDSHLVQSSDDSILASCIDESACDHHCHFSSHMTGFISNTVSFAPNNIPIFYDLEGVQLYSTLLDQPIRPPLA